MPRRKSTPRHNPSTPERELEASGSKKAASSNAGSSRRKRGNPRKSVQEDENDDYVDEAGVGFGGGSPLDTPPSNRSRRGRKAKDVLEDEDSSNDSSMVVSQSPITSMRRGAPKKSVPAVERPPPSTICSACEEDLGDIKELKKHMLLSHHLLWSEDSPEGVHSPSAVFKQFKTIQCLECSKSFNFLSYFTTHLKWCGREDEKAVCPVCEHTVKAMWLKQHMYQHNKSDSGFSPVLMDSGQGEKPKRQAAKKAMNQLKLDESQISAFVDCEYLPVNRELVDRLWRSAETQKTVTCPYKECEYSCSGKKSVLIHHMETCEKNPEQTAEKGYQCIQCGKRFPNLALIKQHVMKHANEENDFSGSGSDYDPGNAQSDEEPQPRVKVGVPEDKVPRAPRFDEKSSEWPYFWEGMSAQSQNKSVFDKAQRWYDKQQSAMNGSCLFSDWMPQLEQWKPINRPDHLLIKEKIPLRFNKSDEIFHVKPEQCLTYKDSQVMNVGGSVWGLDFCPLNPNGDSKYQYLAVALRDNSDVSNNSFSSHNGENISNGCHNSSNSEQSRRQFAVTNDPPAYTLQLWQCLGESFSAACMEYSIRHTGGEMWDIKWCPSHAWSATSQNEGDSLGRLGVLAVACGDGTIHMYSMPHPDGVKRRFESEKMFAAEPTKLLSMSEDASLRCACICMDWSWSKQCSLIIAGFADGSVGLWNLRNRGSRLHQSVSCLLPAKAYQAHLGAVTSIIFSHDTPWLVATGGHDRVFRFWDIQGSVQMLEENMRSRATSLAWKYSSNIICAGYDNSFAYEHNGVIQYCVGMDVRHRLVSNHLGTVWGLNYSLWNNAIASCDSAGWAKVLPFPIQGGPVPDSKQSKARLIIILQVEEMKEEVDSSEVSSEQPVFIVHTYPEKSSNRMGVNQHSKEALRDLHRVVWNQNRSHRKWIACGGQAGLVTLIPYR